MVIGTALAVAAIGSASAIALLGRQHAAAPAARPSAVSLVGPTGSASTSAGSEATAAPTAVAPPTLASSSAASLAAVGNNATAPPTISHTAVPSSALPMPTPTPTPVVGWTDQLLCSARPCGKGVERGTIITLQLLHSSGYVRHMPDTSNDSVLHLQSWSLVDGNLSATIIAEQTGSAWINDLEDPVCLLTNSCIGPPPPSTPPWGVYLTVVN
jgi:hypothetical protein